MNQEFAKLLTEALKHVKHLEGKKIAVIQDELGYALGRESGGSSIEYWRKGNRPASLEDLEKLCQQLYQRTHFERSWFEQFLVSGGHPYPQAFCDRLFTQQALALPVARVRLPVRDFVGRTREIQSALDALDRSALVVIRGMGGVGKTELACVIAQHATTRYPHGHVLVDARGTHDDQAETVSIAQQVLRILDPEIQLPHAENALLTLYHSVLTKNNVLLIFDDVANPECIEPLVPPSGSALIITSRRRWNLPGAEYIDITVLDEPAAEQLALHICPHLHQKATQLVKLCGYLPLAIRVSAGFLASDDSYIIEDYFQQLTNEHTRLEHLKVPHEVLDPIVASLKLSIRSLPQVTQDALGTLSILRAPFTQDTALAILDTPDGRSFISQLRRHHLLDYHPHTRTYSMHALVSSLAQPLCPDLFQAWMRAAQFFIQEINLCKQQYLDGHAVLEALAGFDMYRPHTDAIWDWLTQQQSTPEIDTLVVEFIRTTIHLGDLRYTPNERIERFSQALKAARRLKLQTTEQMCLTNIGRMYTILNQFQAAIHFYTQALELAQANHNKYAIANILDNLGQLYIASNELSQAKLYFEQALALDTDYDAINTMSSINNLGVIALRQGDLQTARMYLEKALGLAQESGYQRGEGWTRSYLGFILGELQMYSEAHAMLNQSLELAQHLQDGMLEAQIHGFLGIIYWQLGQAQAALSAWHQAQHLAHQHQYTDIAVWMLGRFALYWFVHGDDCQAQAFFDQRYAQTTDPWLLALDYRDIGATLLAQHQFMQALPYLEAWDAYQKEVSHSMYAHDHARLEALYKKTTA